MKRLLIILLILSAVLLTACATTIDKEPITNNNTNNQMANPASKFCIDNGGTLDIKTASDGSQTGYCTINSKECEEWSLFRGECTQAHVCTAAEKSNIACTMEYLPVCGSDGKTYGNKCDACAGKVNSWTTGECAGSAAEVNYNITKVLNDTCSVDRNCTTPISYLVQSNCPYTTKCINSRCTVVCPIFDGTRYPNVKDCSSCPQYIPPSPEWCKDGTILDGPKDECGCVGVPRCVESSVRHTCSFDEKNAVVCTLDYNPVCGSNEKTYSNGCGACAAKVTSWVKGECS